ncbi:hypothetical protein CMV30_04415 [Nibricoccus aquaticus]|uniref:RDD family protein n=1 Tax=Nibricoccus aquaticus TaxID=2576891 RepID=A0A290Q4P3_9BACT|nr:RDD family protein [Nibricoccus aquaticus]ATC63257.1 hypothetical protein CMV30_04415 [Nibricoccus aquaticus]
MNWYYAINGQRQGPIAQIEFEKLVSTGVINEQTLVWKEGMGDWKPYSQVKAVLVPAGGVSGSVPGTGASNDDTAVCVVSGKSFPKREMIQYEGRWVSAQHRDEFFQRIQQGMAPAGDGPVPGPYGYGGFWRRFWAKFLDGIITGVVSIPAQMLLSALILGTPNYFTYQLDMQASGGLARYFLFQGVSMVVGFGIAIAYCVYFIRRYQATPGKIALGLKLVRSDGADLTTGRIIGRYFAEMISSMTLLIGYIMAGFDREKKSLHDIICDTRVIKTRQ